MTADTSILANLIAARAESHSDIELLTFVNIKPDGEIVEAHRSYRQLWQNGQALATALVNAGMNQGDSFAMVMQNHPEFVDGMVASSICGTIFVPIDPRTKGDKLKYMLDFPDCRGAIVADYALAAVLDVLPQLPKLEWLWVVPTGVLAELPSASTTITWLADLQVTNNKPLTVAVNDPAAPMQMLFTSGTTGDPKAIIAPYMRFAAMETIAPGLGIGEGDRLYTGLSLTHANAQLITLGASLALGIPCVISRKFTKSRLWELCRRYNCTFFNLLGGMTTAIYSELPKPDDADNPVKQVLSAGMPAAIWEDFAQRFGVDIFEFYGAAEGGLMLNPPGVGPIGSIGLPPPNLEAKVVDEEGNECAPGVQGEIVFRNADGSCPQVAYFKNAEATEKKTRGGWLRMGDIGHTDENGFFYFDYRSGGGIRCNGDFVNPGFVEKAVAEHPQVDDVFVYGIKAASGVPGEKDVVAVVVPPAGTELDIPGLFQHCRATLESNFVPKFIQLMDEIPKTASEKPQERFCEEFFHANPQSVFQEK